jgi:hypothetical protein
MGWRRDRDMKIDGQCHCGKVTYVAEIDPGQVTLCHCTDCQALTGTAFRTTVSARREDLQITGAPALYVKTGDSGAKRLHYFCPTCASPLFSAGEGAEVWGIRWGGIRQRDQLGPTRQIWRRSAAPWVCAFEDAPAEQTE